MQALTILALGFVGFITYKLVNYKRYGSKNKHSPVNFDIVYWLQDRNNWNDGLLGLVLFAIIAKYKEALFTAFPDNFLVGFLLPYKDEEVLYIMLGFLMSYIIKLLRNLLEYLSEKVKRLK